MKVHHFLGQSLKLLSVLFFLSFILGCPMGSEDWTPDSDEEQRDFGGIKALSSLFKPDDSTTASNSYNFKTNDRTYSQPYGSNFWLPLETASADPLTEWSIKVKKNSGSKNGGFGMVLCHQKDSAGIESMLTVMIRTDGYYQIAEVVGTEYIAYDDWQLSDAISQGYGAQNILKVHRDTTKNEFILSINTIEVDHFDDNTEAPIHLGGSQGFLAVVTPLENFPTYSVEIEYEEL